MKRTLLAAITAIVTLVATLGIGGVGAGAADARWHPTNIFYNVWGNDVLTAGRGCHGTMAAFVAHNPAKRGKIRVTVRSRGFTKDNCRVPLIIGGMSSGFPNSMRKIFPVRGMKRKGTILFRKEIWIGSGLATISFTSAGTVQKPTGGYIVVP